MKTQDVHGRSLAKSTALSGFYMEHAISPLEVVKALNDAKISFVLVGAHGFTGWIAQPRHDGQVLSLKAYIVNSNRTLIWRRSPSLASSFTPAAAKKLWRK